MRTKKQLDEAIYKTEVEINKVYKNRKELLHHSKLKDYRIIILTKEFRKFIYKKVRFSRKEKRLIKKIDVRKDYYLKDTKKCLYRTEKDWHVFAKYFRACIKHVLGWEIKIAEKILDEKRAKLCKLREDCYKLLQVPGECPECGANLDRKSKYCHMCGNEL